MKNNNTDSQFRTVRGYQLAKQEKNQLTPAMEDYLEMTYRICLKENYARVGKLSELLHVRPSSTSKMVFKLADQGFLKYERHEIILLTEKGREIGAYLLNRHDIVEQFLTLISSEIPIEETELIEHSLSPETIAHLNTLIEFFKNDANVKKRFDEFRKNRE
ncbi:DtxR family transcriptional regulator [Alkalibaculum sp. M08DMB]|uniref:DtxR family transcriptional regulator n=1 Tax=Alkalibaculum sporogenes TaxID=2655001 RepID=A0A6A7K855_9FIRM|nr:iron dependent repressor, metal binding and dimerization domain protein [Alkalibaculum sporogenes]MPW25552.1 DtxR family transcriptional regulator [Alkalibaculum sporogenes]